MISYSAAQALSPAIEATKLFLFKPFRWQTFFKFALIAMFTEGGMTSCNFNSSFPKGDTAKFPMPHWPAMHFHWPQLPIILAIVLAVLLIVLPVMICISYLIIRLRFSFFDCVLHRQHLVAPAWNRYHRPALRYLGFTLLLGLAPWVVIGATGYAIYNHFKPLFDSLASGGQPSFTEFLPVIAVVGPLFVLLAIGGGLLDLLLNNFVLPHMALEDASIPDALTDVWADFQAEPGQFLLFVLLRFVLSLVASVLGVVGLVIPMVFLVGIGAVIVLLLKSASMPLAITVGVLLGLLALAILFLALIAISGTIGTFRLMYAVLFYAGRYRVMGDILQPPSMPFPQAAFWPPPVPPQTLGNI